MRTKIPVLFVFLIFPRRGCASSRHANSPHQAVVTSRSLFPSPPSTPGRKISSTMGTARSYLLSDASALCPCCCVPVTPTAEKKRGARRVKFSLRAPSWRGRRGADTTGAVVSTATPAALVLSFPEMEYTLPLARTYVNTYLIQP